MGVCIIIVGRADTGQITAGPDDQSQVQEGSGMLLLCDFCCKLCFLPCLTNSESYNRMATSHASIHACTHTRKHACMHTHAHMHAHTHACTHARTHANTSHTHMHKHTCTNTYSCYTFVQHSSILWIWHVCVTFSEICLVLFACLVLVPAAGLIGFTGKCLIKTVSKMRCYMPHPHSCWSNPVYFEFITVSIHTHCSC